GVTVLLSTGKTFLVQTRNELDWRNINGLTSDAIATIALAGDTTTETSFRDADNDEQLLTAPEIVEMGQQVDARVKAIYAASWAIKALDPIPQDYAADKRWPK